MITLRFEHSLSQSIGTTHGIDSSLFESWTAKAETFKQEIFRRKQEAGFAFLDLPDDRGLIGKIQAFAAEHQNQWEAIVVVGIGGSALGLLAIADALLGPWHHLRGRPKLLVVDNIDPTHTSDLLDSLDLKKTLFIIISKSGTTVEPMVLYGIVMDRLKKKFPKDYKKHLIFITDPQAGLLRSLANQEGIASFPVPEKVGGRFSVLSAVGLLPAALVGVDIEKILEGARAMRQTIETTPASSNPALILAVLQFLLDREKQKPLTVMMPYFNGLFRLADWYRQLLAESIGKNEHTGPTPIPALGTTDQHSQLQLYQEGPNNKFFIFLRVLHHAQDPILGEKTLPGDMAFLNGKSMGSILDAAYLGTEESLTRNFRPNVTIEIPQINAETLGELFMLLEFQVTLLGSLYQVNPFDQPGVEESKKITKKILTLG